jgi:cell division septum initiation protein DivIVA
MSRNEDILRAEMDGIFVEVLELRAEVSELKAEISSLAAGIDDRIRSAILHAKSESIKSQSQKQSFETLHD